MVPNTSGGKHLAKSSSRSSPVNELSLEANSSLDDEMLARYSLERARCRENMSERERNMLKSLERTRSLSPEDWDLLNRILRRESEVTVR